MTREEAAQGSDGIRPGYYTAKLVRGGPSVALRIIEVEGLWVLLLNGLPTSDVAIENPFKLPQLRWPAHEIDIETYDRLLDAAAAAKPGEPLADPTSRVDWRRAPPLY